MTSEKSQPSLAEIIAELSVGMDANTDSAEGSTIAGDLASLEERVSFVETIAEDLSRYVELQDSVRDYIEDLRNELADIRQFRLTTTIMTGLFSFFLMSLVYFCVVHKPQWFLALEGALQVPLLVSFTAGSVFMITMLLKGVYRSRHERNDGELLPAHLKELLKLASKVGNSD